MRKQLSGRRMLWVWLAGRPRRERPCAPRDRRRRGRGARRELHRLRAGQRFEPSTSGTAPSAYALQSIPPERLRLYEQAGARFDIDWSFLASIGAQECGNGDCAGVNSAGCAGPMQIAYVRGSPCSPGAGPTLWERYAVNAHPGQPLIGQRSGGRDLHRRADPPRRHGRPAHRRLLQRIPPGGVQLLRRVRDRGRQLRRRGHGARRAVRVHTAPVRPRRPARRSRSPSPAAVQASVPAPAGASALAIVQVAESQVGQGEAPTRLELHDLRAVRGVVLPVRRLGMAARRGAAARRHRALRVLRVAVHLGTRTRREGAAADREAVARRRRLLRARAGRERARRDRRTGPPHG